MLIARRAAFVQVLAEYNDTELRNLVDVAMAVHAPEGTAKRLDSKNKLQLLRGSSEDAGSPRCVAARVARPVPPREREAANPGT